MLRHSRFHISRIALILLFLACILVRSAPAYCEEADELYRQAMQAKAEGNLSESARLLEEILASSPDDVEVIKQYATVLSHLQRFDESLEWFEKAGKLSPDDVEVKLGVARVTSWKGDYDAAIGMYEDILKAHPEAIEAYLGLANVWNWKGDYERAIENGRAFVARSPDDVEGYLTLGRIYRKKGDYGQSLEYYQKALEIEPDNAEARNAVDAYSRDERIRETPSVEPPEEKPSMEAVEEPPETYRFRFDTGYSYTDINRSEDWNSQYALLTYQANPETTFLVSAERYERSDRTDEIYGAEVYRDVLPKLNVHLAFGVGPDADFSPKTKYLSEISYWLPFYSAVTLGYKRLNYAAGGVDTLTAELIHYFRDELYVSAKYYHSYNFSEKETDSYVVRANYDITDSITVRGGTAWGAEVSDILTEGDMIITDVNSYFAGMVLSLSRRQGISLDYSFEDREGGVKHQTVSVGYYCKF